MTTTNKPPVGTFYDAPSWYERPTLPKGHVGFGMTPPRRVHREHRSDPRGVDNVVEGRRTLVGVGTLVMLIVFVVLLLLSTVSVLTNGSAFFGL